jgi:uncharacterized protein
MALRRYFLFIALILLASAAAGQSAYETVASVPNPKAGGAGGYVSDPEGILQTATVREINGLLREFEGRSTAQIAVAILPSIGTEVPKDFATRLFQHWGIGQAENDNGLLLLVVMDQRRSELETGYGMEAVLPDVICYRVLLEELVPQFQRGDYDAGVRNTIQRITTLLSDEEALAELKAELDPKRDWYPFFGIRIPRGLAWYGIVAVLFCLGILVWVGLTLGNKEDLYDKYRHVRKVTGWWWIILFPLPYFLLYFLLQGVLRKLRNKPRYSRKTGELMHRLTEDEEDLILDSGQVTEEEVGSVDYDVWVTDSGDEVTVLRYARRFSKYKACPKCAYRTYTTTSSRVLTPATYSHSGKREILRECKNCGYLHRELQTIPQKTRSSSSGGGFGGGGGSFGGGSSGGGGAGASW